MSRSLKFASLVVVVAALGAGCSGSSGSSAASTSTSSSASSQSSDSSVASDAAQTDAAPTGQDLLAKVALMTSDFPAGVALKLLPDGDKVTDQVTLDVCSGDFPSEAARTARLQQAAANPDKTLLVNNETVLYRSASNASQAFDEIRSAITNCPADQFVPSKVAGVPPLKYSLQTVADDQLGAVAPEHVAVQGTASDQSGKSLSMVQVFQRRGLVMAGVYGTDLATIKPYLSIVAARLAALTPAEAGE